MSYPKLPDILADENIRAFLDDLHHRKEFWQLKGDEASYNFRDPGKKDSVIDSSLRIHSHQLFVRNFVNPNTSYDRLLLAHQPGTGKTLAAIKIAESYIDIYKMIYKLNTVKYGRNFQGRIKSNKETPTVFFLGFTKNNIIKELLKYPELGFITIQERYELEELQRQAKNSIVDNKRYKEFYSLIKKRIVNKHLGGFYEFYGYQELVNRLFISEEINLTSLEKQANKFMPDEAEVDIEDIDAGAEGAEKTDVNRGEANTNRRNKIDRGDKGETSTSSDGQAIKSLEDLIHENIKNKKIQVNTNLLARFEDSLIICDESHYMYNSFMKNNYGVALQYLIDTVKNCKLVLLTATPINNMAPEIIDVLNFLLPKDHKLNKKDFFVNNKEAKPGAIDKIAKLSFGRISFLQDVNPLYFPAKIYPGKIRKLRTPYEGLNEIPYLKFIECPMSDFQYTTYQAFLAETGQTESEERIIVSTSCNAINDIIFPNPEERVGGADIGLYNSNKIRTGFNNSKKSWREKMGLEIYSVGANMTIYSGKWLAKENLAKYSSKYYNMVEILEGVFKNGFDILADHESELDVYQSSEKVMIYHNNIRMGVIIIQEIMKAMNILDEHGSPSELTKCTFCGGPMGVHEAFIKENNLRTHAFTPARFVIIHSEIDPASIDNSITKYNSPDNTYGGNYKILIGSKMISESYDMKSIRHFIITSVPMSISKLNQLLGRGDRKGSHINLPQALRTITIYPLLTVLPEKAKGPNLISSEEYKYLTKMSYYMLSQKVLSAVYSYSVDSVINRDIVMPPELRAEYFPNSGLGPSQNGPSNNGGPNNGQYGVQNSPQAILRGLYFDPAVTAPEINADQLNLSTFIAYNYVKEEIENITYVIKRLFIESPVWTLDGLWAKVKAPPFGLEINPELFQRENFIIALNNFLEQNQTVIDKNLELDLANNLIFERVYASLFFDPNNFYIYKNNVRNKIQQVGKYYILFPVNIENDSQEIIKDIDIFTRTNVESKEVIIDMAQWNLRVKIIQNLESRYSKFVSKYSDVRSKEELVEILEYLSDTLLEYIYYKVISEIVEAKMKGHKLKNRKFFYIMIEFLADFDGIVYLREIRNYNQNGSTRASNKNSQQSNNLSELISSDLPDDLPVGYLVSEGILININGNWSTVSKSTLGRQVDYEESNILIGYYESFNSNKNKFKIRSPIQKIQNVAFESDSNNLDLRNFERGIVCETKNKNALLHYAQALGLKVFAGPKSARSKTGNIKIRNVCLAIRDELLRREIIERKKKSKVKYFYFWYDNLPIISNIVSNQKPTEKIGEIIQNADMGSLIKANKGFHGITE